MPGLGPGFVIVVLGFILALARKYIPAAATIELSADERNAVATSHWWFPNFAMVAFGAIFAYISYILLIAINRYLAASDGSPEMILWPQSAIWWFFPGLVALALSWDVTTILYGLAGHPLEARLYRFESSRQAGFDTTKLSRWLIVVIMVPVGIGTLLALPEHVSLGQDEIHDCGFAFARCEVFRYRDARRMTVIDGYRMRDGKLDPRAGIVIDFADGRRWSSANTGDFQRNVDANLKAFLAGKISLPFGHAETEKDIPPFGDEPKAKP
jgi:hypothetical protein